MSVRDEIRNERKSLKGKGVRAHLQYFWDYYKVPAIVFAAAVVFAIYLIVTQVNHKDLAFSAILLNNDRQKLTTEKDPDETTIEQDFAQYAGIDTGKKQVDIRLDLAQKPSAAGSGDYDMVTQGVIDSMKESGRLDVLCANPSNFSYYLELGTFVDLRDVLTEKQLQDLSGRLYYADLTVLKAEQEKLQSASYIADSIDSSQALENDRIGTYVKPDPSGMDDPAPVGVFVTDSPYIKKHGLYTETECVLGFTDTVRADTAVKFLAFLDS